MLTTLLKIQYLNFEINTMRFLDHPNVIGIKHVIKKDFEVILVLEFTPGKDLEKQLSLKKEKDPNYVLPEPVAIFLAFHMLQGLKYLHDNEIIHRDIKPENTLLDALFNPKLCDFGLCTKFSKKLLLLKCGTKPYMAPEIFKLKGYNHMVDLWAMGITLYNMASIQEFPFEYNQKCMVKTDYHKLNIK